MIHPAEKKAINKWSNSFIRPFVPYNLMEKSTIKNTHDDGAKLVYIKFLYGLQTGNSGSIPFDGTFGNKITNVKDESLWLYEIQNEAIPSGFTEITYQKMNIRTGTTRKCRRCSGQGKVRCTSCNGKIRWHETKSNGDRIETICSCGDGKQNCGLCDGYGDTEDVIVAQASFKLNQTKDSQYLGEVPEADIKKVTGGLIYENQFDYPIDLVKKLLVGGLDLSEMNQLNEKVLEALKNNLESELGDGEIDTKVIYGQLIKLFESITQLAQGNQVLVSEFMPVRVLVRVENAPVKQVDYAFKNKDYSIWVYGKENKIWCQNVPKSFNLKVGVFLGFLLAVASTIIITNL